MAHVRRLRYTGAVPWPFHCLSLWTETDYQLSVDGGMVVTVPDLRPLSCAVAEAPFDPGMPGDARPLSIWELVEHGVAVLPLTSALTPVEAPASAPPRAAWLRRVICIPTIPRMIDALLRQHQRRVQYYAEQKRLAGAGGSGDGEAENNGDGIESTASAAGGPDNETTAFPSLPMHHVECLVRHLRLNHDFQRENLLPKLAPEIGRALEETFYDKCRRASAYHGIPLQLLLPA